jgi:two-component system response regulator
MARQHDVVLVDDNAYDLELTLFTLRTFCAPERIRVLRDGEEVIRILGQAREAPDFHRPRLMLLDLKLPKVDGLEVLRWLRHSPVTSPIPVVIFSSSRQKTDMQKCLQLGANSYVTKPVPYSEFSAVVRQIASYWLTLNQPPPERIGLPT